MSQSKASSIQTNKKSQERLKTKEQKCENKEKKELVKA